MKTRYEREICRLVQGALIGLVLGINGYFINSVTFWIIMAIMALQWIKE